MKTLLIHASFGEGHKKAALALQDFLDAPCKDLLEFCHPLIREIYSSGYTCITDYFPQLWKLLFFSTRNRAIDSWLEVLHRFLFSSFFKYLRQTRPNVIITTHFFSYPFVSKLKQELKLKIVSVVTDLHAHPLWAHPIVDYYIVAAKETKNDLIALGIEERKIISGYVALRQGFLSHADKDVLRKKFSLDDKPCLLFVSSRRGKFPYLKAALPHLCRTFNVLVIYGDNVRLKNDLESFQQKSLKLFPFYENIWEFFELCSIIITKPGGLTIFEGLYKKKMFVFTHYIPGQEKQNMELLHKYGIGKFVRSSKEMIEAIEHLAKQQTSLNGSYPLYVKDIRAIIKQTIDQIHTNTA
jgi:processive 1,2-diacylglycerol beta-glucosyltransferase